MLLLLYPYTKGCLSGLSRLIQNDLFHYNGLRFQIKGYIIQS
jgi:hypothetical protein